MQRPTKCKVLKIYRVVDANQYQNCDIVLETGSMTTL